MTGRLERPYRSQLADMMNDLIEALNNDPSIELKQKVVILRMLADYIDNIDSKTRNVI